MRADEINIHVTAGVRQFERGLKRNFTNDDTSHIITVGERYYNDRPRGVTNGRTPVPRYVPRLRTPISATLKKISHIVESFFSARVEEIFRSLEDQMSGLDVKDILMVGGFGQSAYLHAAIKRRFESPDCQITAAHAGSSKAVADGAVIWLLKTRVTGTHSLGSNEAVATYIPNSDAPANLETIIEDEVFEAQSVTIWPKPGTKPSESVPPASNNFARPQSQWRGGCVLSVHDSGVADDWLHYHYEHELLVHLRTNDIGGPVASMLSVDAPALTIFATLSSQTIGIADGLSQLSGFPVIIRPTTEDPSARFECHGSPNPDGSSTSQMNNRSNTVTTENHQQGSLRRGALTRRPPGRDHHLDEQSEDDDDRTHPPDAASDLGLSCTTDPLPTPDVSFNSYPPPPDASSTPATDPIYHDTDIRVKILVNGENKDDFLRLRTTVMEGWTAARPNQTLKHTSIASKYSGHLLSLLTTRQALWVFLPISSLFCVSKILYLLDTTNRLSNTRLSKTNKQAKRPI
ncbi:hypothetical protein PILCRDRAFT_462232 [Piloderma croceum F 1598]|uniref:Uncharacterized protein n=1 Tax=Piloderma croceum (strain F 1598) TaxID=765440 RepID=A0A0C3FRQ7_PILCF|nr:hypothetical protein PILCRDRAFT_462232 [Piloderma croceum F 1598]